jgi:ribosome biogenesis GTPase A
MTAGRGLFAVLDQVGGLVDPAQAPAVAELARRLQLQRFRVLVVGEAKRGKSTLINAMLCRDVLPVGVVPEPR